jgi:uncharacterized protein (DUF433 family)
MVSLWQDEHFRSRLPSDEPLPAEIAVDEDVMDGLPVVRGTRIPVYVILELVAAGHSIEDVVREYDWLTADQVRAAIRFGSLLAACH